MVPFIFKENSIRVVWEQLKETSLFVQEVTGHCVVIIRTKKAFLVFFDSEQYALKNKKTKISTHKAILHTPMTWITIVDSKATFPRIYEHLQTLLTPPRPWPKTALEDPEVRTLQ
jgi:hypothetical protein